jgi:anti-sigma regulatory factor (Ser/Thr protein kinase)
MVRSLDASGERLDAVLDLFVRTGEALTPKLTVDEALCRIASAVVSTFCDYCAIEAQSSERGVVRVEDGAEPDETALTGTIEVPLRDGRRTFGTILCQTSAPSGFDEVSRKALHVLATEMGVFLVGHALMRREHHVADRLQRALLPEQLPAITGAEFSAAYRPASDEADVGGDWFDAFPLADGKVAISVGDVAGHGLEAAVIMGEIRQAIRTAAVTANDPAAALDHVNRMVALRQSIGIVTAIFAIYDPAESTLVYAAAGHPPPILALSNGFARRLPNGTLPLGCTDALDLCNWTFTVPQGAHVVFYTDGLIENERDLVGGERRLLENIKTLVAEPSMRDSAAGADPAAALLERIFSTVSNRDDAATLMLFRTAPVASYVFPAVPLVASLSRAIVAEHMPCRELAQERRYGILVALGEAIANAVEHAYRGDAPGLIRLELTNQSEQLVLVIEDFGHWRPFVRREDRGRGIELMHACVDGVQIRSTRESTKVLLKTRYGS